MNFLTKSSIFDPVFLLCVVLALESAVHAAVLYWSCFSIRIAGSDRLCWRLIAFAPAWKYSRTWTMPSVTDCFPCSTLPLFYSWGWAGQDFEAWTVPTSAEPSPRKARSRRSTSIFGSMSSQADMDSNREKSCECSSSSMDMEPAAAATSNNVLDAPYSGRQWWAYDLVFMYKNSCTHATATFTHALAISMKLWALSWPFCCNIVRRTRQAWLSLTEAGWWQAHHISERG